jgi:hypothetical protein
MYNLENNPKLGYYTVGDTVHYSKPEALISATKTNTFPVWNFNQATFDQLNWLEEPETDIRELYRLRAQQLRDQYDYIRLEFSGGADSNTILFSFLLNNIYLDEVVFRYPTQGSKNATYDHYNTKSENFLSEYEFATKPVLKWIATHSPKTKITVHDFTDDMISASLNDTWVFRAKDFLQPSHAFKHDNLSHIDHKHLADTGKSICILYGIDKPKLCIKDKKWYTYFIDFQANHANSVMYGYTNLTNEYFFWTPDFTEILRKQVHLVKNWFTINKQLQHLVRWPNHSVSQRTTFEHLIKPLIYPDWDQQTFQVAKPSNNFYPEMDHWFYTNFKDTTAHMNWQAGLDLLVNAIDIKYFNTEAGKPVGFVGFLSPFYCLGDADFVSSGNNDFSKF